MNTYLFKTEFIPNILTLKRRHVYMTGDANCPGHLKMYENFLEDFMVTKF